MQMIDNHREKQRSLSSTQWCPERIIPSGFSRQRRWP